MSRNNKNELNEEKVREIIEEELDETLEYYIEADEVERVVNAAIEKRKNEFENNWRLRHDTQAEIMQKINDNIDNIVRREIEGVVAEQVKIIEDKLLVELARQAMSLKKDEKYDETN